MILSKSNARRLCLWAIFTCGLSSTTSISSCKDAPSGHTNANLLHLGTSIAQAPGTLTTVARSTSIAHTPSPIPGNQQYTLVGCYGQPSGQGRVFGADEHNAYADKAQSKNLTINSCLGACESKSPSSNGAAVYKYAGLRNGSECICGIQLSADARKLSVGDCKLPCPGDSKLSCGGPGNVVIYSHISRAATQTQQLQSNANPSAHSSSTTHIGSSTHGSSSTRKSSQTKPTITSAPKASTTHAASKGTASQVATSAAKPSPSLEADAPKKFFTTPKIIAIAGGFSGVLILGAGLYLCCRVRKRRRLARTSTVKESSPGPISAQANVYSNATNAAITRNIHEDHANWGHGVNYGGSYVDGRTPVLPTLRTDGAYAVDLHGNRTTITRGVSQTGRISGNDGMYGSFDESVRTGSADIAELPSGSSSAVEWRPGTTNSSLPSSPSVMYHRKLSLASVATPSSTMDIRQLAERAWNRRKLSEQSSQSFGNAAQGQRSIPFRGPLGGPPNVPLPPPPVPPQVREDSYSRFQSLPGSVSGDRGLRGEDLSTQRPPMRPRRSLNSIVFDSGPTQYDMPDVTPLAELEHPTPERSALGMSHSNLSTPTVGKFGSIRNSRRVTMESFLESPILGWPHQWGAPWRRADAPDVSAETPPPVPVLPPVAPGERFDHKRWRGTMYTESRYGEDEPEGRKQQIGELSPVSASSVGTSILYTPREFDRRI